MERNIELRYLPIFYNDVKNAVDYISNNLKNIKAANDLVDLLEIEIEKRRPLADSFHSFNSKKERKRKYYKIKVNNYDVYYVIIKEKGKKIMEVRRFLYNKMDTINIL